MRVIGLLLATLASLTALASCRPAICEEPPPWKVKGEDLMGRQKGNVTIVALLMASWKFCLWQAQQLSKLQTKFHDAGMMDVHTIIINHNHYHSINMMSILKNLSEPLPVYQDADDSNVWQHLEGGKDDFYIYDRCGRLAYYVPYPLSFLYRPFVLAAILSTYYDEPCGSCWSGAANITEEHNCTSEEYLINPNCTSDPYNATVRNVTINAYNDTYVDRSNGTSGKSNRSTVRQLQNSTDANASQGVNMLQNKTLGTGHGARHQQQFGKDDVYNTRLHQNHKHAPAPGSSHRTNTSVLGVKFGSLNPVNDSDSIDTEPVNASNHSSVHHRHRHHHQGPRGHERHTNATDKFHQAQSASMANRANEPKVTSTQLHFATQGIISELEELDSENHTDHSGQQIGRGHISNETKITNTKSMTRDNSTVGDDVTTTMPETNVHNGTIRPTVREIYDKYPDYETALQHALHSWLHKPIPNKVGIMKMNMTTTLPTTTTTTVAPVSRKRDRSKARRQRVNRKKARSDEVGSHNHHPAWLQLDLSDCNDLRTKQQFQLSKECCRLEHSNRPAKTVGVSRCEKMTKDKCKKIHLKNSWCKTVMSEQQSEENYDCEEMDASEEQCEGFTPFLCTVVESLQLRNVSCCANLTLDAAEMEEICCTEINPQVPGSILAVLNSKCPDRKESKELWQTLWSSLPQSRKLWHQIWRQWSSLQSPWLWQNDVNRDKIWQLEMVAPWSGSDSRQPWSEIVSEKPEIPQRPWGRDVNWGHTENHVKWDMALSGSTMWEGQALGVVG